MLFVRENMEDLKEKLQKVVVDLDVKIIAVKWRSEAGRNILQVAIDKENDAVSVDLCTLVSDRIDQIIDEEVSCENYYLEVCSGGAERYLESEKELQENLGKYVRVTFKQAQEKQIEFKGYLERLGNNYSIEGFVKGKKKKIVFEYQDVEKIQLSVKI